MSQQTCPSSQTLSAYYDAELDAQQREQVRQHVSSCAACTEEVSALSRLSERFAQTAADAVLLPIELTRLHHAVDLEIGLADDGSGAASPASFNGRSDRSFRRTAVLVSALAASVLIVASAWLWELPGGATTAPPAQALVPAQPWEVAALTLDPLYSNDPVVGVDETRLAEAPIVDFMLDRVLAKGDGT